MMKSLKNMKNEKCTMQDMEYGKKSKNHGNENNTIYVVKYDKKC